MKRWVFALLLVPSLALAEGPKYGHTDANDAQEFENVYNDIRKLFNKTIPSITVSTITASSATFTNASIGNEIVQVSTINALAMNAHKITGLANGTAATDAATFGQIGTAKYIQAVQGTNTSEFTTASNSFQTTNLTQAITPGSASNRVKVTISGMLRCASINSSNAVFSIFRDATNLGDATNGLGQISGSTGMSANWRALVSFTIIDSPATTSATTYSVKIKNTDGATTVGFGAVGVQVIALEEIL